MMERMTSPAGIIVRLADVGIDDLVGPVEVLVQEGLATFSLPVGSAAFPDLTSIYGMRATFGAHAVTTVDEVAPPRASAPRSCWPTTRPSNWRKPLALQACPSGCPP